MEEIPTLWSASDFLSTTFRTNLKKSDTEDRMRKNMGKAFLFGVFYTLGIIFPFLNPSLSAETKFNFPETSPGQFVYYFDTRRDARRMTGLLKFYDGTIVCRTIDTINKTTTIISIEIVKTKNGYEINPQKIFDGDFNRDIQFVLVDLNNIINQQSNHVSEINDKKKSFLDPWPEFDYTLEHVFWKRIPFFNLYSTRRTDLETPFYQVALLGKMQNGEDVNFFKMTYPFFIEKPTAKFKVPSKKEKIVNSFGYQISLDENWNRVDAGKIPDIKHETFWLSVDSLRDAQIGIEKIDISIFPNHIKISSAKDLAEFILRASPLMLADSIELNQKSKDEVEISYIVVDPDNKLRTKYINKIKKISKEEFHITNFSAFLETFDENREYFFTILNSIKTN